MPLPNLLLPDWGSVGNDLHDAIIDRNRRNRLAATLPGAYSGDSNALADLARVSPEAFIQVQNHRAQQERLAAQDKLKADEVRRGQMREGLVDFGATIANAEEGQYPTLYATGRTALVGQYPELAQKLPEQWSPELLPYARALAGVKPQAAPGPTDDMREYSQAQTQGFTGTLQDWILSQKKAGAPKTEVSVNTGQKGFENELKLRGDFRSEPIYKGFQEVQSAYNQIKAGLDAQSPAGDLASATKFMKILDPGSVVRESELGMAMAATGGLDRLYGYAQRLTTGEKLTPSQREDFRNLSDQFYEESRAQYESKAGEYAGIANDYGMNPTRVTGEVPKAQQKPQKIAEGATATNRQTGQRIVFKGGKWVPAQ